PVTEMRDTAAGHPHRHADVERPFVRAHTDAGVEAAVDVGVVAVEVVRLGPCRVAFDGMSKIVLCVEYRHRVSLPASNRSARTEGECSRQPQWTCVTSTTWSGPRVSGRIWPGFRTESDPDFRALPPWRRRTPFEAAHDDRQTSMRSGSPIGAQFQRSLSSAGAPSS